MKNTLQSSGLVCRKAKRGEHRKRRDRKPLPGRAIGPRGALEAAIEIKEKGLVRFIGVTGHGWMIAAMHKRALKRFAFDSVLLPYNYMMHLNERYHEEFEEVVRICRGRNVAVQTIKSLARGPWGITPKNRNTWYQPLAGR